MQPERSTLKTPPGRRDFLKKAAAAAWATAPWIVPSTVFGANAPSNRIQVACIGTGNQGISILRKFLKNADVQIVAVCDVNRASYGYKSEDQFLGREPARKEVDSHYGKQFGVGAYRGCQAYDDFREIIVRKDVDAVTIVVPDHWHATITIRAAEAGKDIYCEKPLSLTIGQGQAMVKAVREHHRILQTGSMERSNPLTRYVCKVVRDGRIGKVQRVITNVGYNNKAGPGPGWTPMPVPNGFDYKQWLGPAPQVPYHKDRGLYRFRFNYDYSGGQVTNFGAHSNDLAQWGLGTDNTGPVEIDYVSAKWLPKGSLFNTALETEFRCRYASGVELICKTNKRPVGVRFEGTEGMVEATAYAWLARSEPASLITSQFPNGTLRFDASAAHVRNFLDCVRTRRDPVAPVEVGHRSASLCHLGNLAIRLGRNIKWDPDRQQIIGDDEASRMIDPIKVPAP